MPSEKLVSAINALMNIDLQSHQIYLQAAAWAIEHNLDGCKQFLLGHATEELGHMHRSFNYLDDRGLKIAFAALPAPVLAANDITGLFKEMLAHENKVTVVVNKAVEIARAENDHDAFEFLQWFVMEQREETKVFQTILNKIDLIGDSPSALYHIDIEAAKMATAATAAAATGA
ncbi:ferritin [Brucellaceae bacterium D45D]